MPYSLVMAIINHHLFLEFQKRPEWDGFTELQKEFIRLFFAKKNLFLSGSAGTGKSYVIEKLCDFLEEVRHPMGLTALTGVAALNIGGSTVHSWAGIGLADDEGMELLNKVANNKKATNRIKNSKLLIIDEISMASAPLLDKIDIVCQFIRNCDAPFGGLQVVFVGDFCLKNGTRIVMANGKLKKIEDILIGDQVMGPDSTPRNVLRKFTGTAPLYKITQSNADCYTVTGNHLIALKRRGNSGRYPNMDNFQTIKASELATKSEKFNEVFGGYKAGCIHLGERPIEIDPYFLGMWLGDGHKDGCRITTADQEIIQFCWEYAAKLGLRCNISQEHATSGIPTPAVRVALSSAECGLNRKNPLLNSLRAAGVLNNKHIPEDYLLNSESNRLKLLAGLLDTDGCWSGNRFIYSSTLEILADNVKQLANHLGFRTAQRRNSQDTAWDITIGGDTWRIPTKIARKKSIPRNLGRCRLNSTLKSTPVDIGDFTGIEVDGDNLFLLEDGTVLHNCQLPPVFNKFEEERFAFESDAWKHANVTTVNLTEIVRQHDSPEFANFLNEVRFGITTGMDILTPCFNRQFPDDGIFPVRLFCKNYNVDQYNHDKLAELKSPEKTYYSVDDAPEQWVKFLDKNCRAPNPLTLKVGAQVMLLVNLDTAGGLVNGSVGVVEKLYDTSVVVRFANGTFPIEPFEWEIKQNEINVLGEMKKVRVAARKQIPLRLAYALSIHKAQGATLDRAEVDASEAFACGQTYVALSRVRNLESLRLKKFSPSKVTVNKKCLDFYKKSEEDRKQLEQFFEQ